MGRAGSEDISPASHTGTSGSGDCRMFQRSARQPVEAYSPYPYPKRTMWLSIDRRKDDHPSSRDVARLSDPGHRVREGYGNGCLRVRLKRSNPNGLPAPSYS